MISRPLVLPTPTNHRLAELVANLTSCRSAEARWAVDAASHQPDTDDDPLATVARAMVLLRHRAETVAADAN